MPGSDLNPVVTPVAMCSGLLSLFYWRAASIGSVSDAGLTAAGQSAVLGAVNTNRIKSHL